MRSSLPDEVVLTTPQSIHHPVRLVNIRHSPTSPKAASATTRSYRSVLRTEQAAHTRKRILTAASRRFSEHGYTGTSLGDIAREAGVSLETVKANGPKRDLLLAAFEQTFAGEEGREGLSERPEGRTLSEIPDNDAYIAAAIAFVAEANRRSSRLWTEFLSAANSDPAVGEALDALLDRRRHEYLANVDLLRARGLIAPDADRTKAAAALSFILSPESHQQLVDQSGWSMTDYVHWLTDSVSRLILAADPQTRA